MDPRRRLIVATIQQHNNQLFQVQQLMQRRRRRRRRNHRAVWVRPWIDRRLDLGMYNKLMIELRNEDPHAFHNFMRMSPAMFDEVVNRLTPRLTKEQTNFRPNLEPGLKVAVTLRHLASGTKYRDMQYAWRVPHNTISKVVRDVCEAIVDEYLDEQMTCPTTEEEWRQIADDWLQRWNFPHTIGAIDGKHVACKAPPNTGSEYYNYKGFFSIILFGMVSSDYKFLWADISGNGAASDAQIYNHSELKQGLESDNITGWPRPDPLPNDTQDVPYFIVGDDAFSLRTYLMKPYSAKNLTREERIYNYRLSRARRVVENAFGIMVNRFQVLLTTMQHHDETVRLIVKACILLHNLMRTRYPVLQNRLLDRQLQNGQMEPGEWRRGQNLFDTVEVQAPNRASKEGKMQRNLIKHWCNSPAGSVAWQDKMIDLV
ncbi:putative nuclease HARBI1 [Saccostrea cucullata]|uniref:putative nuclease HARBI1 n=1 Tax=Saccostrea cuccullata TaxID=36930 RepID=UPI002ED5B9AD